MVIFGAGVVTGAMVTRARIPESTPVRTASKGPPLPGPWRQPRMEFVQKVRNQLNLTADQSAQVDRIMQDSHDRMVRLWEPIAPHAREETRIVREQIQGILTPEQKAKFEEICKPRRRPENRPDHHEKQRPADPSEKL
jgi:Spy/CpxP family protein refolding chaperone